MFVNIQRWRLFRFTEQTCLSSTIPDPCILTKFTEPCPCSAFLSAHHAPNFHVPSEPFVYVSSYYILRLTTFQPLLLLQLKVWSLHHTFKHITLCFTVCAAILLFFCTQLKSYANPTMLFFLETDY